LTNYEKCINLTKIGGFMENVLSQIKLQSNRKINNYLSDIFFILFGTTVLFLSAYVYIPVPGNPVPITLQVFSVLMIGAIFGTRKGIMTTSLYATLGALGLPVFSNASGGLLYLAGPTGGYIIGFILAIPIIGFFYTRTNKLVALLSGLIIIYLTGWLRLTMFLNGDCIKAFCLGVATFIPFDIAKTFLAYIILKNIKKPT
jgi:biotin transport system substrate-specific component